MSCVLIHSCFCSTKLWSPPSPLCPEPLSIRLVCLTRLQILARWFRNLQERLETLRG
uniref:Uncharacterized protein n=1 Tax=Arundo donax TaxID=35708 RepID=A0A0A9EQ15_ARUDO